MSSLFETTSAALEQCRMASQLAFSPRSELVGLSPDVQGECVRDQFRFEDGIRLAVAMHAGARLIHLPNVGFAFGPTILTAPSKSLHGEERYHASHAVVMKRNLENGAAPSSASFGSDIMWSCGNSMTTEQAVA